MNLFRDQFLLDPSVTFLNHGSFGACPKPVFEDYQRWQLQLERQPVEFLGRRADELLLTAREALGRYVHSDAANLIFVPNATIGLNTVIRSLPFNPGDEILSTDHEYGALDLTWKYVGQQTGVRYVRQPIPLPITTAEAFVESFWSGVTARTRAIFISQITSPTALIFPVAEICRRARAAGIMTIIDGAHAPGQIPLDLAGLDPDFYSANLHKWLCAPKGSAFLYVRPDRQKQLDPLVISWGWSAEADFVTQNQWQGTRDLAPFLSVPAAIEFQAAHGWEDVRARCHRLAVDTLHRIAALTGIAPIAPDDWFGQMVAAALPPTNPVELKRRLYDDYRVEVPITVLNGRTFVRVSIQAYNDESDADRLLMALETILR